MIPGFFATDDHMLLPEPNLLGLPDKFSEWRPGQAQAVLNGTDSRRRFVVQCAPTGFGKTPVSMTQAMLTEGRTAFLTKTKGLQAQLLTDFAPCGLVDVRGEQNYPCPAIRPGGEFYARGMRSASDRCDAGPCHFGMRCSLRYKGCPYFDAVRRAKQSSFVVTNYAYWIFQHRYGDGLGAFDLLILDEAHDAPDELAASLTVDIYDQDITDMLGMRTPAEADLAVWIAWAAEALEISEVAITATQQDIARVQVLGKTPPQDALRRLQKHKRLNTQLGILADINCAWTVERHPRHARLAPTWPWPYAEQYLFRKIPKVVFVSATVKPKTLELLGLSAEQYDFHEYPSSFPVARRPVIHVPSVRLHHRWTDTEQRTWVERIDQILDRRLDRKGIIHTVSYARRDVILTHSRHRKHMLVNDGANTRSIVEQFRKTPPPAILVSPSLTTGWDLPFGECEFCIISKIPFPDTRSTITAARTQADPEYGPYLAMTTIVQAAGRGMRSADDQCEIFIVDDQWSWFWSRFKKFAPQWFAAAVRRSATVPPPPPKLTTTHN
jgi:Rad3-related DNA helicase